METLTPGRFYSSLIAAIIASAVVSSGLSQILDIVEYMPLSYAAIALFTAISLFVYFLSERAAKMKNKNFFMQIVMINTMIKMFSSVVLVIGYHMYIKPHTTKFIVPFILIYIIFSIYETYFMMKQSSNVSPS